MSNSQYWQLCKLRVAHWLLLTGYFEVLSFIGTIFIPHLGQWPGVSLITSGCIVHVYFAVLNIFEVSVSDAETDGAFLFELLLSLHAENVVTATSINAMSVFFIPVIEKIVMKRIV